MAAFLPYGKQSIDDADVAAVSAALRSALITQGPLVDELEGALAKSLAVPHVSVCVNGTAALHLAYAALGLAAGDEIVTTPITFIATANAARYLGADVRFADVEPDTGNLDASKLEAAITPRTKGIVAVHFGGLPCDMAAIRAIAERHRLWVVADAAHAFGAPGLLEDGDAATLSFHPVKHLTTGEGGAVCVKDAALKRRVDRLRHHGIERDASRWQAPSPGPWYHEMPEVGWNYRLTDIQCALGLSQLARQPQWLARRRAIAQRYRASLARLEGLVRPQATRPGRESVYHLFPVRIDFAKAGRTRAQVMDGLKARGVGTQVHYIPVNTQPAYRALYGGAQDLPGARQWYESELSLPMYPTLSDDDVDRVVEALRAELTA